MSPIAIAIQTLIIGTAIQLFVRKEVGLILAFILPGCVFGSELVYFSFFAPYQGGGASMFFPALLIWSIPVAVVGLLAGKLFWWAREQLPSK